MGETAGAIAAGDLSQRVEPADDYTEVGRLGLALNSMLGQIEKAFAERTASEARLRRFVADASHELRTPLTSIRGYAELFRRGANTPSRRPRQGDAAHRGGRGTHGCARRRPAAARPPRPGPPARVRVGRPGTRRGRGGRRSPRHVARPAGELRVGRCGDRQRRREPPPPGAGQPARERAHAHACRHTGGGAGRRRRRRRGDRGARPGPRHDRRGRGARAFERFWRADPSRDRASGGAGLGLAIVSAITEAHGGRAEVETAPGEGATFRIRLPRERELSPAAP